jgi:hypothetical protein
MATADPTKHLRGYGRRDQTTGMLRGPVYFPNGYPPVPSSCRWCGQEQGSHGQWWRPGKGYHRYEQPTQAQIKARMRARRLARLTAEPPKYHATTGWAADRTGESADPYCADCRRDGCRQWMRIQHRIDMRRMQLAGIWPWYLSRTADPSGGDQACPF